MSSLQDLPLHAFHEAHGARFVPFGDWNMPVQYAGILEEHRAVREAVGLFDVSHMGEFHVYGTRAGAFLDHLLVNSISNAPIGKAVYSPMCQPDGGVVDDLIVYRTGETEYLLCVNASNCAKDLAWIQTQAQPENFEDAPAIEDHSADYALLALQGTKATEVLAATPLAEGTALGRFRHAPFEFEGHSVRIARTGYTGEDGYEIYTPVAVASALAQTLLEAGTAHGLKLCGLGARDSLRLEAGLPLYGHELTDSISPLEAALDWTVKLNKSEFIGKGALEAQEANGLKRRMLYFTLEGRRIARAGTEILNAAGEVVGEVCSGTLSPILNGPIGSALVATTAHGSPLHIDLRGHIAPLEVKKPPLHQ